MKASKKKALNIRIFVVGCFFGFLFAIISVKAFYLHVFKGPWLSKRAATEYRISSVSNGKRGIIYDRNYHVMAVTIDGQSIAAHPKKIKNPAKNARLLANTLDMKTATLKKRLASNRSFVWVKRRVSPRETKQIQKLELEGLDFIPEHDRHYTKRTLAAQVIGFTGTDGKGLEGLEYSYNKYLAGTQARSTFIKDALGRRLTHNEKVDDRMASSASSGNNLILTLDQTIQYISENVLKDTVEQFRAKSGIAIVMNPTTGAVLALAHYPEFNPNTFRDFDNEQWRNRAITDPFEPGSTMKVFSAAAAIETKAFPNDTIFYCEKGAYKIGRNTVHDTKPHAWLTLEKIIKVSSNIGMIKVSEKTGAMALYNTFRKFGFGKRTGIDCPGETAGSLSDYTKWSDIDKGTISFGHGLSVSAIQLVTATCAIANGGILMKPYIVQAHNQANWRAG
ncbi:penicillin-binding protein 2 [Desulfobacterales bacterium HSG16]|nr:penicillin-binding protein 2 [Desulfobacterales bacterium HSG16]